MEEEDHELVFVDSAKKKRSRLKTVITCLGVTSVCVLAVTVLSLAIALGVVANQDHGGGSDNESPTEGPTEKCPTPTCRTESCIELAQVVGANLDTTVDPCVAPSRVEAGLRATLYLQGALATLHSVSWTRKIRSN